MKPISVSVRLTLGAAVLSLLAPLARAEVPAPVAERLMQLSGTLGFLYNVSPSVQSYMLAATQADAATRAVKRENLLPLSQALQKAYAPERLRRAAVATVARQLTEAEAQDMQTWLTSAVGQRVSEVETQRAEAADNPGEMLQRAVTRLAALSNERRTLLADVLSGTHVVELQTEVLVQSLQAIHRGTAGFMPQAAKVSAKDLKARLEAQRPELQKNYEAAGLALAGTYYAALSDEQLTAYRAFLLTPTGERYNDIVRMAVIKALKDATAEASQSVEVGAVAAPAGMPGAPKSLGGLPGAINLPQPRALPAP